MNVQERLHTHVIVDLKSQGTTLPAILVEQGSVVSRVRIHGVETTVPTVLLRNETTAEAAGAISRTLKRVLG